MTICLERTQILKTNYTFSDTIGNTLTREHATLNSTRISPYHVKARLCSAFYRIHRNRCLTFLRSSFSVILPLSAKGTRKKKTFAMSSIYFEVHCVQKLRDPDVTGVSKFCNTAVRLSIEEGC
uniref:Uncharacterized protein n=1 Tax=Parascaris univalens TaxID=6257 RepID=A0A915A5B4_PARUN